MFSTQFRLIFGLSVLFFLISCDNAESVNKIQNKDNKISTLNLSSTMKKEHPVDVGKQGFNNDFDKNTQFQKSVNQENDNGNEYFNIKDGANEKSVSEDCSPGTSWNADYKRCQPIDMCAEFGECNL